MKAQSVILQPFIETQDGVHCGGLFRSCKFWLLIIGLIVAWLFIPFYFPSMIKEWFDHPEFPKAGFWVLGFSILAVKSQRNLHQETPVQKGWLVLGVFMLSLLYFGDRFKPYLMHYYFLVGSAVTIYGVGGKSWLKIMTPGLIILILLSGFPAPLNNWLIDVLKEITTRSVCFFCQTVLSEGYERSGYLIYLPMIPGTPKYGCIESFMIAEECSGIRSLFGMILLSFFWMSDYQMNVIRKVQLVLAGVVIAVFSNMVRIGITAILFHVDYDQYARGLPHSLLGQAINILEVLTLYFFYRAFFKSENKYRGKSNEVLA